MLPKPNSIKTTLDDRQVALYPFDDGTGTTAAESGGGTPFTFNGLTWAAEGGNLNHEYPQRSLARGFSAQLNGTTQHATAAGLLATPPAQGSLVFWLRLDSLTGDTRRVLSCWNVTGSLGGLDFIKTASEGLIFSTYVSGTEYRLTSLRALSAGRWYHIAYIWGPRGLEMWIDGTLEAVNTNLTTAWPAGSDRPFTLGGYNFDGTPIQHLPVRFDDLSAWNQQLSREEIWSLSNARAHVPVSGQLSRLQKIGEAITPTQAWEDGITYEFRPYAVPGDTTTLRAPYTGSWGLDGTAIGYAESTDNGRTWSHSTAPVIGQGHGGVAGGACRPRSVYYNGTHYHWWLDLTTSNWDWGTSPDGHTITRQGTAAAAGSFGFSGIANVSVFPPDATPDGVWRALVEGRIDAGYRLLPLTASAPGGPWTADTRGYARGLQLDDGSVSGPCVVPFGSGRYGLWYHVSTEGLLPSHVFAATTNDYTLWDWDRTASGPVLCVPDADTTAGVNQVSDPAVIQWGNETLLFAETVDQNGLGKVWLWVYRGTPEQLMADVYGPSDAASALSLAGYSGERADTIDNADVATSTRLAPAGTLARVTLTDTMTTYTGNTPQTGDAFNRIGATGSGLTTITAKTGLIATNAADSPNAVAAQLLGDDTNQQAEAASTAAQAAAASVGAIASGNLQASTSTTITLAAGASSITNAYAGYLIRLTATGEVRTITAYNGTTKVATVDAAWKTTPTNTTQYLILPDRPSVSRNLTVTQRQINVIPE
jgi:hypothetical protein